MISCRKRRSSGVLFWPGLGARTVAPVCLAVAEALLIPHLCFAQVQLPAVNLGETSFEDGFGFPGLFVQECPESYVADERRDGEGKWIPSQGRLIVYSTTTHVAFISEKRILRGWLAGEVLQPLVGLEVPLASGASSTVRGFGDLTLGAGLQWDPLRLGMRCWSSVSRSTLPCRPAPIAIGSR